MRRSSGVIVVLLSLVVAALISIASAALPGEWRPYLWIAWPLAAALSVPAVVLEVRKSRVREDADAEEAAGPRKHVEQRSEHETRRELPRDVPDFTNRIPELARIEEILQSTSAEPPAVPVLAIHGMAGVGKTSLAVHAAHRVASRFPDGQLFVDLHGFAPNAAVEPADALDTLLRALRVPASPDLSQGLVAAAGGRAWRFWAWILGPGYDGVPAGGPGCRGFHSPLVSFLVRRDGFVLVRWGAGWPGRVAMRW